MAGDSSKPKEAKALLCPPDPKFILKTDLGHIHCLNFSLTDKVNFITLYVGTEDGELAIWNLTTKKQYIKERIGPPILNILLHDSTIITQDKEGTIKMHLLEDDGLSLISSTNVTCRGFCKSIIIDRLFVVPVDDHIDFYDIHTMGNLGGFDCVKDKKFGMVMCLTKVETSFGLYLLVIYETGDGVLWNINTYRKAGTIKFQAQPISATFEPKRGRGIVVGLSDQIQIFEVRSPISKGFNVIYHLEARSDPLTAVKSRPDGLVFVVGGSDGKLRYFSWKSMKLLVVLTEHDKAITDIQFIPKHKTDDSKTIMVASCADGSISIWDLY